MTSFAGNDNFRDDRTPGEPVVARAGFGAEGTPETRGEEDRRRESTHAQGGSTGFTEPDNHDEAGYGHGV